MKNFTFVKIFLFIEVCINKTQNEEQFYLLPCFFDLLDIDFSSSSVILPDDDAKFDNTTMNRNLPNIIFAEKKM